MSGQATQHRSLSRASLKGILLPLSSWSANQFPECQRCFAQLVLQLWSNRNASGSMPFNSKINDLASQTHMAKTSFSFCPLLLYSSSHQRTWNFSTVVKIITRSCDIKAQDLVKFQYDDHQLWMKTRKLKNTVGRNGKSSRYNYPQLSNSVSYSDQQFPAGAGSFSQWQWWRGHVWSLNMF